MAHVKSWYITRSDQQLGPFDSGQMKQMARSGELAPTDQVWKEGMANWVEAARVKGMFSSPAAATPAPPSSVPPAAPAPASGTSSRRPRSGRQTSRSGTPLIRTPLLQTCAWFLIVAAVGYIAAGLPLLWLMVKVVSDFDSIWAVAFISAGAFYLVAGGVSLAAGISALRRQRWTGMAIAGIVAALIATGVTVTIDAQPSSSWLPIGFPVLLTMAASAMVIAAVIVFWAASRNKPDRSPYGQGEEGEQPQTGALPIIGGVAAAVLVGGLLVFPAIAPLQAAARLRDAVVCQTNLRQILTAIIAYSDSNVGLPVSIDRGTLGRYLEDRILTCPSSGQESDYVYLIDYARAQNIALPQTWDPEGKGTFRMMRIRNPSHTILAWEDQPRHGGKRNVGFADTHVEMLDEPSFQSKLSEILDAIRAAGP